MSQYGQSFRVGSPSGNRATPWKIIWFSHNSEVYLSGRMFNGELKVSIHQSGECHIELPEGMRPFSNTKYWRIWNIDPAASYVQAFGIITPTCELRDGNWKQIDEDGTHWVTPGAESTEIAILLLRIRPEPVAELSRAGWSELIVYRPLPDGRDLCVVAGPAAATEESKANLRQFKDEARWTLQETHSHRAHPRACGLSEHGGIHRWIDVDVNDE
jgi:hypothetical protein